MEMTAQDIASVIGGLVEGDADVLIRDFAKIEEATPGSLTFLANPKYTNFIYTTKASVVLVRKDFQAERPVAATLVRVDDPYAALALLMAAIEKKKRIPTGIEEPSYISEGVALPEGVYVGAFSYIGKGVEIGNDVKIYPQVYIGEGCKIGAGSVLYSGVKVYGGCRIGERCILHSGAVIGADGFGFAPVGDSYEKIPQMGGVIIGNDVEIGANTTVDRATFGNTVIGDGTKLDNLIQIAHNVEVGENNVFAAQTGVAGSVKIGNHNRFGGQVGFAGHIKIGDNNEIGAQSGIHKSIGSDERLIGYPAVELSQFVKNQVYLKRLPELFRKQK